MLAIKLPYGFSRLFCGKKSSIRYYIDIYVDAFARALSNLKYCEHQGERMILFKKVGRVASSFNCAPSSDFTLQSSEMYYVTDKVVVIWRFTNGAALYRFVVKLLKMIGQLHQGFLKIDCYIRVRATPIIIEIFYGIAVRRLTGFKYTDTISCSSRLVVFWSLETTADVSADWVTSLLGRFVFNGQGILQTVPHDTTVLFAGTRKLRPSVEKIFYCILGAGKRNEIIFARVLQRLRSCAFRRSGRIIIAQR